MSTPVLPVILRGAAIVIFNGYSYYFKDGLVVKPVRGTFPVTTDMFGTVDTRVQSLQVTISGNPAGEMESLIKYYPYGPSNLVALAAVADAPSIFTGSNLPLVIHRRVGQTITFTRGGISKSPTLSLSPRKTAFGPMEWTALGSLSVQQTSATWLKAIANASFTDTGFDDSKVITDIYTATLGSRGAPYNAMGARDGFEFEPVYSLDDVPDDGVGIADRRIVDLMWKCRFAPNNLTEAQVDALAMWQDTGAIIPGQSVSKGPAGVAENLVIAADVMTATLFRAGVVSSEHGYGVKVDVNGKIEFASRMSFTTGAANPLVSLVLN